MTPSELKQDKEGNLTYKKEAGKKSNNDLEEHFCIHELDFGILFTKIDNLIGVVEAQTKVVANLVEFQIGLKSVQDFKDKENLTARQKASIIVSGIIGVSAILTSIILKIL